MENFFSNFEFVLEFLAENQKQFQMNIDQSAMCSQLYINGFVYFYSISSNTIVQLMIIV